MDLADYDTVLISHSSSFCYVSSERGGLAPLLALRTDRYNDGADHDDKESDEHPEDESEATLAVTFAVRADDVARGRVGDLLGSGDVLAAVSVVGGVSGLAVGTSIVPAAALFFPAHLLLFLF